MTVSDDSEITKHIDIERPEELLAYLRNTQRIAPDEVPAINVLAGGVSNRTVLVERPTGEAWVLKQALAKLRVQVDWFSDPTRIVREGLALRWLEQLAPPGTIPSLVFEDTSNYILAMQAVPQPHENWKKLLLAGKVEQDHVAQFGTLLGTIHRRAYERCEELAPLFSDRTFFESLRLEPYYAYTATQVPQAHEFLTALIEQTRGYALTFVHGDYSPKNILVLRGKHILLDHEVAHFGDPAFDLGFSLTHLLSKAHHLSAQRFTFARAALHYWHYYCQALGDDAWAGDLEARTCQHTLACLLARVAGRSPLEYLSQEERAHQQQVVLALLKDVPQDLPELISTFVERV